MIDLTIADLSVTDEAAIERAAVILVEAFREHWPEAWPTLQLALKEVHEMLEIDRVCRALRRLEGVWTDIIHFGRP